MPTRAVIGLQWGDEGKGKVIDFLSRDADIVVRAQGGPNAGHTVVVDGETAVFHLLPCGILRPHTRCVLGNGVVIDPPTLQKEMAYLDARGVSWQGRVSVSHAAHLILPYHRSLDRAWESRRGTSSIGTTGRGIGPAYADKITRVGLRMVDLENPDWFRRRLLANLEEKRAMLGWLGVPEDVAPEAIVEEYLAFGRRLAGAIADTSLLLNRALAEGKRLLFEGAQGTLLDLDLGTYPYVTSSNAAVNGLGTGTGVPLTRLDEVIGVAKAYATRVGNGPFPTELPPAEAERVRGLGDEFGATTGRPRRCGWLDAVLLRYGVIQNGVTALAITKLDILDHFDEVKVCTAYRVQGTQCDTPPHEPWLFERVEPVFETLPGWKRSTCAARRFEDLPAQARAYLHRIEELAGAAVWMVSVGSGREQTLLR